MGDILAGLGVAEFLELSCVRFGLAPADVLGPSPQSRARLKLVHCENVDWVGSRSGVRRPFARAWE